ncbi:MAG: hypothetical protein PVF91_08975 [Chromatiales bacterium]|jgi:hypothetical protein
MRNLVTLTAAMAVVLAAFYLLVPGPRPEAVPDLPWQIDTLPDGTARVLGLQVGADPLRTAVERYGDPDGLSLFVSVDGQGAVEAYFGTIRLGLLKGELIATLDAPADELAALRDRAIDRKVTRGGASRYLLGEQDQRAQLGRIIRGLTYIPAYSGMDAEFIRQRFGDPAQTRQLDDTTQRWLYPEEGLSILIDSEGREVFEYVAPRDFHAP